MKKILLAVVLAGFGVMVGCDDKPAPKTSSSGTSQTKTTSETKTTTAPAADTTKK
jgi:hypothetical protein